MRIYLAGPLFTAAEIKFNVELTALLRAAGHEVWLPQEHEQRDKTAREIFEKDVEGIDWANVVVANMDGPDPDSGTCWECGYAYKKIPIVIFRTDFRAADDGAKAFVNLMMTESADRAIHAPFADVSDIAGKINEALASL